MPKIADLINNDAISAFRDEVNKFAEIELRPYIDEIKVRHKSQGDNAFESKDIHDAVWGTISLTPSDVIVIDSPIIQRLRRIHHLGLAGILFPGADYSRFEHTLGTVHITQQICSSLNSYPQSEHDGIVQLCKFAAIFHDSGHLFYSHASEKFYESAYYSRHEEVENARNLFILESGKKHVGFSEILSILITTSPAVAELIKIAWSLGKAPHISFQENDIVYYIASLILGVKTNHKLAPYHTIISGSIDADKCDYLARDSLRTGVPVAVDLHRVIKKLKVIKGKPDSWGNLWDEAYETEINEINYLGISLSAVRTVEEIIISRSLMHEKIYYHHKILSAEEMLRYALQLLDKSGYTNIQNIDTALKITDCDIVSDFPNGYLLHLLDTEYSTSITKNKELFNEACDILKKISKRYLFKRSVALFYSKDISDIFKVDPEYVVTDDDEFLQSIVSTTHSYSKQTELLKDVVEFPDITIRDTLIDDIKKEIYKVCNLVGKNLNEYLNADLAILIVKTPKISSPHANIPIDCAGEMHSYKDIYQGNVWDNARKTAYMYHYIICHPDLRTETYLASEVVLYREYGLLLGKGASTIAKIDKQLLWDTREKLLKKDYYKDYASLLTDNNIFKPHQIESVKKNIQKFIGYEGPYGFKISSTRIVTSYIKQFYHFVSNEDRDMLIDGMINLLNAIEILDRKKLGEMLEEEFLGVCSQANCKQTDIHIAAPGNLLDSAIHMGYFFNDLKKRHDANTPSLIKDILTDDFDVNNPILMYDDACYSGKQIISMFQEMLGYEKNNRIIPESHGIKFNDSQKKLIKECKIYIRFCYSNKDALTKIHDELNSIGLNVDVSSNRFFPKKIFDPERNIFSSAKQLETVKQVMRKIGIMLLSIRKIDKDGKFVNGWDEDKVNSYSLGYNNAQQCIILPWNTPTYTLTPLWSKGMIENTFWIPLFPRQSK